MRDRAVAGNGVRGFGLRGVILSGVATVAASLALSLPATAAAEERVCRGTIGDRTLDNIRVPQGERCELNGTKAQGTVKIDRGATLVAKRVRVIGNVQAENARRTAVRNSRVDGAIQVVQSR